MKFFIAKTAAALMITGAALADGHAPKPSFRAMNQDVSLGIVSADAVTAGANGWLVVHRTDTVMKPGAVVGYAPLRMGGNTNEVAVLTEQVASSDMLMLMVQAKDGGMKTGGFEYMLGAKEDGSIKPDGKLVMQIIKSK